MDKGFSPIFIVIVVGALVLIGASAYFLSNTTIEFYLPWPAERIYETTTPPTVVTLEAQQTVEKPAVTKPPLQTYRNAMYGFEVRYSAAEIALENSLSIETAPQNYICRQEVKGGGKAEVPSFNQWGECRPVVSPFDLYVGDYLKEYLGLEHLLEKRAIQTQGGVPAYLITFLMSVTNIDTGVTTQEKSHFVLVDAQGRVKDARALKFSLLSATSLICSDGICQVGETPASCPADCPKERDLGAILGETFATFRFVN